MQALVLKPKNPAAVALAKRRAASQTPERRREVASLAAKARWEKWRKEKETVNANANH